MTKPASLRHFVLIHGVGHGAWCWFRLRRLLEADGCKVTCLDLTSAGVHLSDADSVVSFEEYDKPLVDFMSSLPENEKVVLVGHSAGGLSLTHIMHEFPEKISVAIFIAGTMLPSGFLSEQDMKDVKFSELISLKLLFICNYQWFLFCGKVGDVFIDLELIELYAITMGSK